MNIQALRKIAQNNKLRKSDPHLSNELLKIAQDFQQEMQSPNPTVESPLVGETQYAGMEQKVQKPESSKHTVKFDVNVPAGSDVDDLLITGTLYKELQQLISSKGLELSGFSFTKTGG